MNDTQTTPKPDQALITQLLEEKLGAGTTIELKDLTGTGDHLQLKVCSERFRDIPMVDQHRLVYGALGDLVKGAIHALMLETSAPKKED